MKIKTLENVHPCIIWYLYDAQTIDRFIILQEGVPVPLEGHTQEIESLLTEGHMIVSHCIGGKICVWDALTGECIVKIRYIAKNTY